MDAATLIKIQPLNIPASTPATVTITGTEFDSDLYCDFNSDTGTNGAVTSTSVIINTPAMTAGAKTVSCYSSNFGPFTNVMTLFVGNSTYIRVTGVLLRLLPCQWMPSSFFVNKTCLQLRRLP